MNYIDDANDFVQLICSYEEVILFPRGGEGSVTLEFLRYTNLIKRICCIATGKVDNFDNTLQKFDYLLPVIPLEYLLHFRESALMIIAIPPQMHDMTEQSFKRIGFKHVIFLSPDTLLQIQNHLQKLLSSGQALAWFIDHVTKKINEVEYRVEEQNEVCTVNTKAFAEYRNCFRGRKIVIFASGPTSKYYKPIPDAIHIGVNFAWRREDIPLDYLFTTDGTINKPGKTQVEEGFDRVRGRVFIGMYIPRKDWMTFPEDFSMKKNVSRFYFTAAERDYRIQKDICYHNLINFGTVVHPALHFALFTYPKEIYLVGCDTTPTGHFYGSEKQNDMRTYDIKVGYARVKMFAKHYYPNTEIISINPVGLKDLFRDVYTEDYLASLTVRR